MFEEIKFSDEKVPNIISSSALIGENSKVWHYAQIRENASIGKNCILGKNVYIDKDVVIGDNCKIQNNSSIYHGVTLSNGVFVGPHCIFTNDKQPRAINIDGNLKSDNDWQETKTLIKQGASFGAKTVVLPGITVGKFAMVGAGSVVTKDVSDFGLVYGNPAKLYGYVCKCGQKLPAGKIGGDNCSNCINLSIS
jgi:UDP-2-acetamido-3-amino-2,3-dideoxy-glucuronate N-acetyltransferase